ncbi:MAG: MBL fold metallo-hydrolase [Eubacteriales bacterium]|nr:MBL fold metallo-hydrolase [Eubacteriales bacterium]
MTINSITGFLESNCYLVTAGNEGAIIDPGAKMIGIMEMISKAGCKLKYIILTHVHLDHIISVDELRDATKTNVLVHINEAGYLPDMWYNASALFGMDCRFQEADRFVKNGDNLRLGDKTLEIIHTPGHTPGSISIKCEKNIFTGDTLFRMSVGRTDLGSGNRTDLDNSLKILAAHDEDTVIYPGHGLATSLGYEKKNNPFIV